MKRKEQFERPGIKYWPEVRWWLAEGFHTDQTLIHDIGLIHEAGFGAIEFLAMDEEGADSSIYGWGSEEWVHDSHIIMKEGTRRNMGISLTSGTNWSNANLITITPDDRAAAKELDFTSEVLAPGASHPGRLSQCPISRDGVHKQELIAVVAIKRLGEGDGKILLDPGSAVILTEQAENGQLDWTAPGDGTYEVFAFWLHGTGQTASPSVSVSYTINYIDRYGVDAFIAYWNDEVITDEIKEYLRQNDRIQMYMDSLELSAYGRGGQFWGYHFLEEFEERRGYDLTPWLPFVLKESGGFMVDHRYHYTCDDAVFLEKLHNDLYQTMTDLYMENMLRPMQEWLHSINMTLRAEISYGLPFEISQPGKYVDGIETESLEFCSQIESYRNLAGPAHLYRRLYSSETGASLMNYMMGLNFYTQIIYTQFAAGVARTVLHGYASIAGSDAATSWPGHEGMWPVFSERFGVRQPAHRHYRGWTDMIARNQMILRRGKPRVDLAILRLDYNFNNLISWGLDNRAEREYYEEKGFRANEGLYWKDMTLQNMGYTYDYFAPQILEEEHIRCENGQLDPQGAGYQAVIIYQEMFPLSTADKLMELAANGVPILFVNGVNETLRPEGITCTHKKAAARVTSLGAEDRVLRHKIAAIKELPNVREAKSQEDVFPMLQQMGIRPRAAFTEPNSHILTNLRQDGEERYLFVYNHRYTGKESVSVTISMAGKCRPRRLDCWRGTVSEILCYRYEGEATIISLDLKPGEAGMVFLDTAGKEVCQAEVPVREVPASLPEPILLENWELEVEDWKEGEKNTITEDRGLGIVTNEVYYETARERISVGRTALIPWKDMPQIGPEVSGIGYYTATAELPEDWVKTCKTVLRLTDICQNTAAVYVNGMDAGPVDFTRLEVDITEWLKGGENTILVEVSSTLNNRLLARGYYIDAPFGTKTSVQDYGLLGPVILEPYAIPS